VLPPANDSPSPSYLIIGRVSRPHGVRGDLRVLALTPEPERLREIETVFVGRDPDNQTALTAYTITRARPDTKNEWLLHLVGIDTRDDAERFRGCYLFLPLSEAVPLAEDEVYLFQIIGAEVRTESGEVIGHLADYMETGAHGIYVVRGERYGEVLIPDVEGFIRDIRPTEKIMIVRLLPGLLPTDPDDPDETA